MRRALFPDEWAGERGEIFALYKAVGVCDEGERHRLQHALTGCSSLRYMTGDEHRRLISALAEIAGKPAAERDRTLEGLLALGSFDYDDPDA